MTSVGIDADTGNVLVGWSHVIQSITKIVTTELGSRVERRDLGSLMPTIIDKPQNEETLLDFFMSIATAIEPRRVRSSIYGEPRFKLLAIDIKVSTPGVLMVAMIGKYFPDGHKSDGDDPQNVRLEIPIPTTSFD